MNETMWPTHAYVPGKTARHPEGAFDLLRGTAHAGLSLQQLAECQAFRLGLRYLHEGYYWEAHELLEPVWMLLPNPSPERAFVQGLIQLANGFLKLRMARPKAAARLLAIARAHLQEADHPRVFAESARDADRLLANLEIDVKSAI